MSITEEALKAINQLLKTPEGAQIYNTKINRLFDIIDHEYRVVNLVVPQHIIATDGALKPKKTIKGDSK